MPGTATRTTCPYCGVGCGVLASVIAGEASIAGDPDHPANFGRLCSKGAALAETLGSQGRLAHPMVAGRRATWDDALALVAERFSSTIAEHGPDAVALYVSGQLLSEDYYVANKLMKGFIGSANIDTNSRLCMASSVAGHRRAFGADVVPGVYEDFELADLVVLVGSNLAWCHPVLFQRLVAARQARGTRIVVVDPRRTPTAEAADLHLALAPGSDVALFAGLLAFLVDEGYADADYVGRHTAGAREAIAEAKRCGVEGAAAATGLARAELLAFYRLFAGTERTVTAYSQGVHQSTSGTDKVTAIVNCHLLTGRIGREGMGPFSLTGQPNAMGGREVGGLANALAAHMDLADPEHRKIVRDAWNAPRLATQEGLKAVDMFRAVADGRIRALWIMATNPVVSMPDADAVEAALRVCPFVVVSDVCRETDTTRHAHVLLPAAAWGEKDGTVTNSERRVSRQRSFLPPYAEAMPDWWIVAGVARRMGFEGFDYASPADVYREYAALTAAGNEGRRVLDLGAHAAIRDDDYAAMAPYQWPLPASRSSSACEGAGGGAAIGDSSRLSRPQGPKRLFANGRFATPDGRGRLVPTPPRSPATLPTSSRPLVLNTGRIRDQWHTMTWTSKTARLTAHVGEPFVEIHPEDARALRIAPATLAVVESCRAAIVVRALVSERQRRGSVFVPMHWSDRFASSARVDALVGPFVDPLSGQPELKCTPVSVAPFAAAWYALAVIADPHPCAGLARDSDTYWASAAVPGGLRCEMAGRGAERDWTSLLRALAGPVDSETLEYRDERRGHTRLALFRGERLAAALFVAREPVEVSRSFVSAALGEPMGAASRSRVLAGRAFAARDLGALVCACHGVCAGEIDAAVAGLGAATVDDVARLTRAGSGCGSCRSEIAALLRGGASAGDAASIVARPLAGEAVAQPLAQAAISNTTNG